MCTVIATLEASTSRRADSFHKFCFPQRIPSNTMHHKHYIISVSLLWHMHHECWLIGVILRITGSTSSELLACNTVQCWVIGMSLPYHMTMNPMLVVESPTIHKPWVLVTSLILLDYIQPRIYLQVSHNAWTISAEIQISAALSTCTMSVVRLP